MNLLVVDDEYEIIAGMTQFINFEKLGFKNVFTAQSAQQARDIILNSHIDILLTDIEMPLESGLDLLRWVRDSRLDIVTLFCTGYPSFDYAQKALELHSFDYYLKPIDYKELTKRIESAAQEVQRIRAAQNLQKYGSMWLLSREDYQFSFWHRAIAGSVSGGKELTDLSRASLLSYTAEDRFTLCVVMLADDRNFIEPWKKYAFKNMTAEIFSNDVVHTESILPLTAFTWCVVFREEAAYTEDGFLKCFSGLSLSVRIHLSAYVNFYYSAGCTLDSVYQDFKRTEEACGEDVVNRQKAVDARRFQKKEYEYIPPELYRWQALLTRDSNLLLKEARRYLDERRAAGQMGLPVLKAFRVDVMQMIHDVLSARQIDRHTLYLDEQFHEMYEGSLMSVYHMERYMEYLLRHTMQYISKYEQSRSVVGKVQEYIGSHLSEKITRTSMAKLVFMNSDYLARIFKKETGLSLGEYLQVRRIEEAKRQLAQTDIPVSVISQNVGYDNFSYFSYLFHERTGMTPVEYRKTHMPAS